MADKIGKTRQATRLQEVQINTGLLIQEVQEGEEIVLIDAMDSHHMFPIQSDNEGQILSPKKHVSMVVEEPPLDNEMFVLLASGLKEFWQRKIFHDVTIYCTKDGGTVNAHRLVLAGLSPVFQLVLKRAEEDITNANEDGDVIILPDVSSSTLLFFLDSVYNGKSEEATIDEELEYLQFSHEFRSNPYADEITYHSNAYMKADQENECEAPRTIIENNQFRTKRSFVWDYFSPVGKQNAQCHICKKVQKVEKSSTTYLIRHLKSHHTKHYLEGKRRQDKEENTSKYDKPNYREDLDDMLETSSNNEGVEREVTRDFAIPTQPKAFKPSPSKFRSLTGQIAKLAKNKNSLIVEGHVEKGERRKRSLCWKYFTRLDAPSCNEGTNEDVQKISKCNICGQSFPLSSTKSTILMLRHLRKRHQEVLDSGSSRIKQTGKKKAVKDEDKLAAPKGKTSMVPLQQQNTTNTITHESEQQGYPKQEEKSDIKTENIIKITGKPTKRRQNATLREQKELRERSLIMFSKPTKPRVKTPSVAWIFFDVINKDTARCIICENIVPTPLWNTNGLLRHLKKDHLDECEQWEAENVHNFDPSNIPAGQIHPIWQHFKQMEESLPEPDGPGSYACNYCDIAYVGMIIPQQISKLEAHLTQFHPDDAYKEYEMEKVAILCRKRKEEMKVVMEEPVVLKLPQPLSSISAQDRSAKMAGGEVPSVTAVAGNILLQPHDIIHDIKRGLLNVLAGDFFTQFSRDTMQCKLCSASCKVLTTGPNRSNNLWKHLSVSHVDVHAQLEAERELIAESLKRSNREHPIWAYFKAQDSDNDDMHQRLFFTCLHCQREADNASIEIGGHLSEAVEQLEGHLLIEHCNDGSDVYRSYQKCLKREEIILSLDQLVWIETFSGIPAICDSFFENVDDDNETMSSRCFKCKVCKNTLENMFGLDLEEEKCRHVLQTHKLPLINHMKISKQKGPFLKDLYKENKGTGKLSTLNSSAGGSLDSVQIEQGCMSNVIVNQGECICSKCDNCFASFTALEFHDRYLHFGERPYACNECERTFVRSDELKTHKKYHSDRASQKGAMCVACGKQFNSATARKRHENTVHLDIRNHGCKSCGKKFHSPQALERHTHTHSEEKPFVCTECGAKFREKHQLTSHFRTHTGEASITCPNCPQTFKHYAGRSKHKCTEDLLVANKISGSWSQSEVEKVDVSVVTVSAVVPHQFKKKQTR